MLEKWTKQPPGTSGASITPQPSSASNHLTTPATAAACPDGFRVMGPIVPSAFHEGMAAIKQKQHSG
jgi:hypothetical protein